MADSVSQDPTHQEGVGHIKDTLADRQTGGTTEGSTGAGDTFDYSAQSGTEGVTNTGAGSNFDSSARSGTEDEKTTGVGNTFDSESKGIEKAEHAVEKNKEEKEDTSGEKPPQSSANPKSMENRDAIPTAGGQKLGEKHWGESKIVAENPKPQDESAGVSSSDGQPTSETASNTAKNTGGASGGPHSGSGDSDKPTMTDKIKDKLPFGKK